MVGNLNGVKPNEKVVKCVELRIVGCSLNGKK